MVGKSAFALWVPTAPGPSHQLAFTQLVPTTWDRELGLDFDDLAQWSKAFEHLT